jgi:ribonuclease Z
MNSKLSLFIGFGLGILFCLVIITLLAFSPPPESSPVKALSEREVYYPGTEDLASDEMRVVALGTGMPNARPKQAAACWLVELGNGDKFLFDR